MNTANKNLWTIVLESEDGLDGVPVLVLEYFSDASALGDMPKTDVALQEIAEFDTPQRIQE